MQTFKQVTNFLLTLPLLFSVNIYANTEPKSDPPTGKPIITEVIEEDDQAIIESYSKQKPHKEGDAIEALHIDAKGNVGIGTAAESSSLLHTNSRLHVSTKDLDDHAIVAFNNSNRRATIYANNQGNGVAFYGVSKNTNTLNIRNTSDSYPTLYAKNSGEDYAANFIAVKRAVYVKSTESTPLVVRGTLGNGINVHTNNPEKNYPTIYALAQGKENAVYAKSATESSVYAFNETGKYAVYAGKGSIGPFTGAHDALVRESLGGFEKGMLVSITGKAVARLTDDGDVDISDSLPVVKLTDVANDKKVFGAFVDENTDATHWHQAEEGEKIAIVNAVGEGRLWVTNINGHIEAGDFITSSVVPGYGMKQDSDSFKNFTVAKAIETVNWDAVEETVPHNGRAYKRYLLAVVYMAG